MPTLQQKCLFKNRRRQILAVAREMFAEHGYNGTTTRGIAARAQVNEAIIFRHFASKKGLYSAVLEDCLRPGDLRQRLGELLANANDVREGLTAVAEWTLRRCSENHSSARLSLFCALERHALSHSTVGLFMATYCEVVAEYLRRQMGRAALRSTDALMAARMFMGTLMYYSLVRELFGDKGLEADTCAASREIVSIWLDGMLPKQELRIARSAPLRASTVAKAGKRLSGKVSMRVHAKLQEAK